MGRNYKEPLSRIFLYTYRFRYKKNILILLTGCKWTFRQLRRYLEQSGHSDWLLWQRIACIVTLTILSQAAGIPKSSNCFEFFGFDILIDDNLKPWLLEVVQI